MRVDVIQGCVHHLTRPVDDAVTGHHLNLFSLLRFFPQLELVFVVLNQTFEFSFFVETHILHLVTPFYTGERYIPQRWRQYRNWSVSSEHLV